MEYKPTCKNQFGYEHCTLHMTTLTETLIIPWEILEIWLQDRFVKNTEVKAGDDPTEDLER